MSGMTPEDDPYAAILALAERKLELASAGEIGSLKALDERFEQLTSGLAKQPPASARALLRRAALIYAQTDLALLRLRETLLEEMRSSARASRAARGYARQLRHPSRLDRSA